MEEVISNQTVIPNSNQEIKVEPVNENVVNSVPLQSVVTPLQPTQPVGPNPIPQVTQEPVQTVNMIPQVVQETAQTINPVPEQKTN